MSASNPTKDEADKLQQFYLSCRELLSHNIVPPICVQRSFEEAIAGFQGDDGWRPTHISRAAAQEVVNGFHNKVQRAHGAVEDRLDRYDRTLQILSGAVKPFHEWWAFWRKHDSTIVITRGEHGSGHRFKFDELIAIPQDGPHVLFVKGGFSFKVRKRVEVAWLRGVL